MQQKIIDIVETAAKAVEEMHPYASEPDPREVHRLVDQLDDDEVFLLEETAQLLAEVTRHARQTRARKTSRTISLVEE